jgi:hypothetical protein
LCINKIDTPLFLLKFRPNLLWRFDASTWLEDVHGRAPTCVRADSSNSHASGLVKIVNFSFFYLNSMGHPLFPLFEPKTEIKWKQRFVDYSCRGDRQRLNLIKFHCQKRGKDMEITERRMRTINRDHRCRQKAWAGHLPAFSMRGRIVVSEKQTSEVYSSESRGALAALVMW